MAVSKNTKNKYNASFSPYNSPSSINSSAKNLAALSNLFPEYQNTYADSLKSIYQKIKNTPDFSFTPDNDSAYRRFADEYNALSSLAIAANQNQAQELTGGYGSSYAPEVANQGLTQLKGSAESAKPAFLEMAQQAYMENNDLYKNMYDAAALARDNELKNYSDAANAFAGRYDAAQKEYSDARDFDFGKFDDDRSFWAAQYQNELENENSEKLLQFKKYDTYADIAENKCAEFNEKKNNKGMRNYLNSLVEQDKITGYIADNLYRRYKYTAPATRSSGGRGGSYSRNRSYSSKSSNAKFEPMENWLPNQNIIKFINLNNRADDYGTALEWIDYLVKEGRLDENEKYYYVYYYQDKLRK